MEQNNLAVLRSAVARLFYGGNKDYKDFDLLTNYIESSLKENAVLKARLDKAVELPCAVGQHIYELTREENIWEVQIIAYFYDWEILRNAKRFGVELFLTEAEALEKLEGMKGGAK